MLYMEDREDQLERERRRRARIRREKLRQARVRRVRIQRIKFGLCAVLLIGLVVFGISSCNGMDSNTNSDVEHGATNVDDGKGNHSTPTPTKQLTPTPSPQSVGCVTVTPLKEPVLICIDAGHGFSDPGCVSDNLENGTEADITLKVAKILKEKLEEVGAEVILTHDGETFPDLKEVKAYANKYGISYNVYNMKDNNIFSAYERAVYCQALGEERKIDFFISLHINAVENTEVSRYDIYYSQENPSVEKLRTFCSGLETNLDNKLLIHETTRGKSMYVTKYSKFPSVLLEMGFATNLHDAANLNSDDWRQSFTRIVANQIVEYVSAD